MGEEIINEKNNEVKQLWGKLIKCYQNERE